MKKIYLFNKRFFDIFLSIIAIILLLIPWFIIFIIIKIVSPGPAIYKAKRIGKDGKVFTLYKFRSMKVNSGKIKATTLQNDDRVFPFGKFLRKSKLDETPQLINILKGDMSIIGPRPEDEINSSKFYIDEYKQILTVRPGLSSPASLYDYTHGELYTDEELYIKEFLPKKLKVELYYVNHRGFFYDLKLIFKTIIIIIQIMFGKKNFKEPIELNKCIEEEKNNE